MKKRSPRLWAFRKRKRKRRVSSDFVGAACRAWLALGRDRKTRYPGSNQATRFASLNREFARRPDAVLLQAEPQSSRLCLALRAHRRLARMFGHSGKGSQSKRPPDWVVFALAPPAGLAKQKAAGGRFLQAVSATRTGAKRNQRQPELTLLPCGSGVFSCPLDVGIPQAEPKTTRQFRLRRSCLSRMVGAGARPAGKKSQSKRPPDWVVFALAPPAGLEPATT